VNFGPLLGGAQLPPSEARQYTARFSSYHFVSVIFSPPGIPARRAKCFACINFFLSLMISWKNNYLGIYRTDFLKFFSPNGRHFIVDHGSFSDRLKDVTMATSFGAKLATSPSFGTLAFHPPLSLFELFSWSCFQDYMAMIQVCILYKFDELSSSNLWDDVKIRNFWYEIFSTLFPEFTTLECVKHASIILVVLVLVRSLEGGTARHCGEH